MMIKSVFQSLLFLVLTLNFSTGLGQAVDNQRKPMLVFETGVIFSKLINANPSYELYKADIPLTPNFYGGLSFCYPVWKTLFVEAGIYYNQRETNASYHGTTDVDPDLGLYADKVNADFQLRVENNYITVPAGVRYNLKKVLDFSFETGLYLDLLNKSSYEIEKSMIYFNSQDSSAGGGYGYNCEYQRSKSTREIDFGPYFGLGVGYEFRGGFGINLNSTFEIGLLNIDNVNDDDYYSYVPGVYGPIAYNYHGLSSASKNYCIKINCQFYFRL